MAPPTVLLAPGVYRIPTLGNAINSFAFLEEDGQVTLVDCGISRAPQRIVDALAHLGRHPSDVTRILLTHAHFDHAGGASGMLERTGVEGVDVHEEDARFIAAGVSAPTASTGLGRLLHRGPSTRFDPVVVSQELTDGQLVPVAGGVRVLHTPGHTPGHVSLLHEASGVLITGDIIWNMAWRMTWPFPTTCTDGALNQRSAHVLGEAEYTVAAFTHGPEIRERAREQVRGFLRRKGVA
ncbi:MAG TPA: MBL fold metallo-hydrolase [Actinobacteria bacterium]|nr:MBL fold metallo-hydrolase [Actinomycetota bacterium]